MKGIDKILQSDKKFCKMVCEYIHGGSDSHHFLNSFL
jgi:hypothetical protein